MKRGRFRPKPLSRRRRLLLIAAVVVPVLALFLFGNRGLIKRFELEMRYDRAYADLYAERAVGDSLRREITRLQEDSGVVEKIARERFGMARRGERIYKTVQESENQ